MLLFLRIYLLINLDTLPQILGFSWCRLKQTHSQLLGYYSDIKLPHLLLLSCCSVTGTMITDKNIKINHLCLCPKVRAHNLVRVGGSIE